MMAVHAVREWCGLLCSLCVGACLRALRLAAYFRRNAHFGARRQQERPSGRRLQRHCATYVARQ